MDEITVGAKLYDKSNETHSVKTLNIVIKTLKERCYLLQRRLHTVEDENTKLSKQCAIAKEQNITDNDIGKLNAKIAQLSKENAQLTQHVLMVACENKNLWNRLATLSSSEDVHMKDTNFTTSQVSEIKESENKATIPQLIRSQTFTQPSPNPKLVAKCEEREEDLEASLEEISLKILNSFIAEKSELVLQYEQMVEIQKAADINIDTMGFTYMGDGSNDSFADIKLYTQKLMDLKDIVLQQQEDLKTCLNNLEAKKLEEKLNQQCSTMKSCIDLSKENTGIESPETEVLDSSTRWATPANSTSYHDNIDDSSCSQNTSKLLNNIKNSKNKNEDENSLEKKQNQYICPLCGEKFQTAFSFEKFQKHVETHFAEDSHDSFEDENFVLPVQ